MVALSEPAALALRAGVVLAALFAVAVVVRLDNSAGSRRRRLRSRLLLGVPWGTLVSVALVLFVYFAVQGGWGRAPLALPFYSWSYFYPLGMVTAPFAHSGLGHLTGNLVATLTLAPLAEYAFSHFPVGRGKSSFSRPWNNPYVRAFLLFPLGVVAVGLCTSLLSWGPLIGFSGVVYAFAGYALVRFPFGTVVALSARDAVSTAYYALQDPIVSTTAEEVFSTPWWAGVAVQGHLLGLFLGVLLGALTLRDRPRRPSALRLWAGATVVGASLSLWALWWYSGADSYVLYRGPGLALVLAVGLVVAAAVRAPDRTVRGVNLRTAGLFLLFIPLLTMAFVAVPYNLTAVDTAGPGGPDAVEVRGYTVQYVEDVTNPKASVLNLSALGASSAYETSGVVVSNPERQLWSRAVSPGRLAYDGQLGVRVGGVGWSERVGVRRAGWEVLGNGTVYRIEMRPPGGDWRPAFESDPVSADLEIDGRTVSLVPEERSFSLVVARGNTSWTTPIPGPGTANSAGGLTFVTDEGELLASTENGTRIAVATNETYQ
jgi:membrane associated rhomboid family serine protease